MLVKGKLSFQLDGFSVVLENQKISPEGATDLPWGALDAHVHFGRSVFVQVSIIEPQPFEFIVAAQISREISPTAETMGLLFYLNEELEKSFTDFTNKHGEKDAGFHRKFPRIPSRYLNNTHQVQAIITTTDENNPNVIERINFNIENLSPEGMRLSTTHPAALKLTVNKDIRILLEAPQLLDRPTRVIGSIRRLSDDFNVGTQQTLRQISIQILRFEEQDKAGFDLIMKQVVLAIRQNMAKKP